MPNPCEYIYESVICTEATAPRQSASLDEYVDTVDIFSPFAYSIMNEHANAAVIATPKLIVKYFVREQASMVNKYVLGMRAHIGEEAAAAGTFGYTFSYRMSESAGAASVFTPVVRARRSINEHMSASDSCRGGFRSLLSESVAASDIYVSSRYIVNNMLESISFAQTYPIQYVLRAPQSVTETAGLSDSFSHRSVLNAGIAERVTILEEPWFRSREQLAWQMNTETTALNWHTNYSFDSISQFGNTVIAASKDGIYVLSGETDGGISVESTVKTGFMDFEERKVKRMGSIYFGLTGTASVSLETFEASSGYTMPVKTIVSPGSNRITPGKGLISRYWRVTFTNYEGQDMDIDNIEFDIAPSNNRRL